MTRCRPALDTASSCARCQWRNARWPEHALADSRFDQPLPGLGRSVHHSQSVKGGGASSPVSNVSIPSWCHRNHPSTTPPALGRWTCRRPHVCFGSAPGTVVPPCKGTSRRTPRSTTTHATRRTGDVGRAQYLAPTSWTRAAMLPSRLRALLPQSVCLARVCIL